MVLASRLVGPMDTTVAGLVKRHLVGAVEHCRLLLSTHIAHYLRLFPYFTALKEEARREGGGVLVHSEFMLSSWEPASQVKGHLRRNLVKSAASIFVSKPEWLQQIVTVTVVVSEAVRRSLKKKGLSSLPWRKPKYMKDKWLSSYQRAFAAVKAPSEDASGGGKVKSGGDSRVPSSNSAVNFKKSGRFPTANTGMTPEKKITVVVSPWQPPELNPISPVPIM